MRQVTIGELASPEAGAFKIGPFGSSLKKNELVPKGIPVAGIENVHPNRFDKSYRRFISEQKFRDLADYEIRNGDVLVTTMGTIGRAAVVSEQSTKAIFDSHLFRMRFDLSKVHPPYLCFVMNSQAVMSQLGRQSRGSIRRTEHHSPERKRDIPPRPPHPTAHRRPPHPLRPPPPPPPPRPPNV